jgi:RNA 3'-terminal phosphate cyclase
VKVSLAVNCEGTAEETRESSAFACKRMKENETGGGRRIKKSNYCHLGCQLWVESDNHCALSVNALLSSKDSTSGIGITAGKFSKDLVGKLTKLLWTSAAVDEFTADQLLLPMALAVGRSEILVAPKDAESSLHIDSVIHVTSLLLSSIIKSSKIDLPHLFNIETLPDTGCRLITCNGVGGLI